MHINLKRPMILAAAIAALISCMNPAVHAAPPFPYPTVPDTISSLTGRADYYVTHFWDKADMKRIFSNRQNVKAALGDYFAMMPHAKREVAAQSIESLLGRLAKQPKDLAFMAETAQAMLYSDSAAFWSDELMLPFAAAAGKKVETWLCAQVIYQVCIRIGSDAPCRGKTGGHTLEVVVHLARIYAYDFDYAGVDEA